MIVYILVYDVFNSGQAWLLNNISNNYDFRMFFFLLCALYKQFGKSDDKWKHNIAGITLVTECKNITVSQQGYYFPVQHVTFAYIFLVIMSFNEILR